MMVNVPVVLLLLPQSSVAVKVTVSVPVAPHRSERPALVLLQVTPLQISLALALPFAASHAAKSPECPTVPSHSYVGLLAAVILGAVVSMMVKVPVVLLLLPQSSVAV